MFAKVVLVSLVAFIHSSNAAVAPFITKCRAEDSKCMKSTAQVAIPIVADGLPALGVKSLDPFFLKSLDASSKDLKLVIRDITATGLKECIAKKIQRDVANSKLTVKLLCTVDVIGQYEMKGKLLFLPIEGKGGAHVVLNKVLILAEAYHAEVTGADGQTHWKIKSYNHSYELKDQATIELENLFKGNEALGRAASDLIKSSPNEIVNEVGPPIIKAVVHEIVENVNQLFSKVPLSEMVEN